MTIENIPYELSTDYELLWTLIKSGKMIAGWAWSYTYDRYEIVSIKFIRHSYLIGSRGISYGYETDSLGDFLTDCKTYKICFIPPNNQL